jgi:hypothetical protein
MYVSLKYHLADTLLKRVKQKENHWNKEKLKLSK